jgi:hypothetical protein
MIRSSLAYLRKKGLYASFMSFAQMNLVFFFVFNLESQNNVFTESKIHITREQSNYTPRPENG